ncbi:MAG: hypothetical protein JNK47_12720 [Mesorhizobium sp.]|nr:hypothetical protein [Mesorhizobium sp.]MBL8578083.1 hypothetical protein [Mesorhizobium sp.]
MLAAIGARVATHGGQSDVAVFPAQDTFVRGELSPRLHARASLDLYRAGLAICENFITLPHGGIRKRGGTYFCAEVKNSAKKTILIPFIYSSEQAYCLEVGDLYIRIYAYGSRVGSSLEVATPYLEADIERLRFYQSADQMWIVHPSYAPRVLTRTGHTTWSFTQFVIDDGPYDEEDTQGTTITPAAHGSITPTMTSNTAPSGTVAAGNSSSTAWRVFDRSVDTGDILTGGAAGYVQYRQAGGAKVIADAYYVVSTNNNTLDDDMPSIWQFKGSNDGTNWVTLDSRKGETAWQNSETRFFEFENSVAYEYYRFDFQGGGGPDANNADLAEIGIHRKATDQTPFNLTASAVTGINGGAGFQTTDVGRAIRLMASDGRWRWARIIARTSTTVVTVQLYGHALPDLTPISRWQLGTFIDGMYPASVQVFEERLAMSRRFSAYLSASFKFEDFGVGEEDDDAMVFRNAGGGQANDIVWLRDADGFLLLATTGGIRALSGSGIDEALKPSSFKNRRSRTTGCAAIDPVDAGPSFLYVSASRKAIMELVANQTGRFQSDDVAQISEHIPKKGVVSIDFQSNPDPIVWFPLDSGELGSYTHQPAQEVRGLHRQVIGGAFSEGRAVVERAVVTPGDNGVDDVWLIVKRTINGSTKRYIEVMTGPFEYGSLEDAFQVDCGLTYTGSAVGTFSGLSHLEGQKVDVLANSKIFKELTVASGSVTLPGSATATKAHIGLRRPATAETLELDVGGRDGSLGGRRKKVGKVILSLLETDTTSLRIRSKQRGKWESVKIPTVVPPDGKANLYTGNIEVPIDDSWEGQGKIEIVHDGPTPCTIRSMTPVFDAEP